MAYSSALWTEAELRSLFTCKTEELTPSTHELSQKVSFFLRTAKQNESNKFTLFAYT